MNKRYSKEEVVELIEEYRDMPFKSDRCTYRWLNNKGLKAISIEDFNRVKKAAFETLGDNQFDIDAYIGELNRQRLAAECDKSYNTPIVNKPNNKRKQYSVQDEIERKERIVEDNTPSYDKVMKAIDRAEDRGRMNSKHIHTLQQAVNTLLDDKIEGTWWSRLWNRNN